MLWKLHLLIMEFLLVSLWAYGSFTNAYPSKCLPAKFNIITYLPAKILVDNNGISATIYLVSINSGNMRLTLISGNNPQLPGKTVGPCFRSYLLSLP